MYNYLFINKDRQAINTVLVFLFNRLLKFRGESFLKQYLQIMRYNTDLSTWTY